MRSDATRPRRGSESAAGSARAGQNVDPDEYKATRGEAAILGTIDEAAERLRAYEQAGVERVMLQHLDHTDLEMVELIGRELAPAVA